MRALVLVAAEHAVGVAPEHELAVEDGERERRVVGHLLARYSGYHSSLQSTQGGDGLGEKEGQISLPYEV